MSSEDSGIEIWKLSPRDLDAATISTMLELIEAHGTNDVEPLHLKSSVASDRSHVLVAKHAGEIVGTATINVSGIPSRTKGYVEDVVVDEQSRRNGAGEGLVRELMAISEEEGCEYFDLNSSPYREAANRLYQRLGLIARDTNNYRYYPKHEE